MRALAWHPEPPLFLVLLLASLHGSPACGRRKAHGQEEFAVERFQQQQRHAALHGQVKGYVTTSGAKNTAAAPLRIHAEYQLTGLDAARTQFLQQILIPAAAEEIGRRLLVRYPVQGNLTLQSSCSTCPTDQKNCEINGARDYLNCTSAHDRYCSDEETGVIHNRGLFGSLDGTLGGHGVPNADFVLYVATTEVPECQQGTVAYAGACEMDLQTSRPLAGYINICPSALIPNQPRIDLHVDDLLETVVHELVHILFFSSNLFKVGFGNQFHRLASQQKVEVVRKVGGGSAGHSRHLIVLPEVIAAAASHFGCPGMEGVELSNNELPPGNHWEDRLYMGELMDSSSRISMSNDHSAFSAMTLALAEASGWYLRNPASAQGVLPFGRLAGCQAALQDTCHSHSNRSNTTHVWRNLHCPTLGAQSCTYDHFSVGRCASEVNMDGCYAVLPLSASGNCRDVQSQALASAYRGMSGRCLLLKQLQLDEVSHAPSKSGHTECFRMRCKLGMLFVQVGDVDYACPEGQTVSVESSDGNGVSILGPCPENSQICDALSCAGDCNGHGTCSNGTCECYLGWMGQACERRINALQVLDVILSAPDDMISDQQHMSDATSSLRMWISCALSIAASLWF